MISWLTLMFIPKSMTCINKCCEVLEMCGVEKKYGCSEEVSGGRAEVLCASMELNLA